MTTISEDMTALPRPVDAARDLTQQRFRLHTEILATRNNVAAYHRILPDQLRERLEFLDIVLGMVSFDIDQWVKGVTK